MKTLMITGLLIFCSSAFAKDTRKPASVPLRNVQVGGEKDLDACAGSGIVLATTTVFKIGKNGGLEFGKVDVNQQVASCDSDEEYGNFIGIVFGKPGQDCKVSSPIPNRQDYKGSCKSGWIKKEFFHLMAG